MFFAVSNWNQNWLMMIERLVQRPLNKQSIVLNEYFELFFHWDIFKLKSKSEWFSVRKMISSLNFRLNSTLSSDNYIFLFLLAFYLQLDRRFQDLNTIHLARRLMVNSLTLLPSTDWNEKVRWIKKKKIFEFIFVERCNCRMFVHIFRKEYLYYWAIFENERTYCSNTYSTSSLTFKTISKYDWTCEKERSKRTFVCLIVCYLFDEGNDYWRDH